MGSVLASPTVPTLNIGLVALRRAMTPKLAIVFSDNGRPIDVSQYTPLLRAYDTTTNALAIAEKTGTVGAAAGEVDFTFALEETSTFGGRSFDLEVDLVAGDGSVPYGCRGTLRVEGIAGTPGPAPSPPTLYETAGHASATFTTLAQRQALDDRATSLEGRATAVEGRATALETRADATETGKADSDSRLTRAESGTLTASGASFATGDGATSIFQLPGLPMGSPTIHKRLWRTAGNLAQFMAAGQLSVVTSTATGPTATVDARGAVKLAYTNGAPGNYAAMEVKPAVGSWDFSTSGLFAIDSEFDTPCALMSLKLRFIFDDAGATNYAWANPDPINTGVCDKEGRTTWVFAKPTAIQGTANWAAVKRIEIRLVHRNAGLSSGSGAIYLYGLWSSIAARTKVQVSFDDGSDTVYNTAFPILAAAGLRATANIVGGTIGTGGIMSLAQITALYNAGWDIANHTYNHVPLTLTGPGSDGAWLSISGGVATFQSNTSTPHGFHVGDTVIVDGVDEAGINGPHTVTSVPNASTLTFSVTSAETKGWGNPNIANFTSIDTVKYQVRQNADWLIAHGFPRAAEHVVYPNGSYNDAVIEACREVGMKSGRTIVSPVTSGNATKIPLSTHLGLNNPYRMSGYALATTAAAALAAVDQAIATGTSIHLYGHAVSSAVTDGYNFNTTEFQSLVTGLKTRVDAGQIDVVTISELVKPPSDTILVSGTDYTLGRLDGKITFTTPPDAAADLAWDGVADPGRMISTQIGSLSAQVTSFKATLDAIAAGTWTAAAFPIGTGDGVSTVFPLPGTPIGTPVIKLTDWQGKHQLFSTARTNMLPQSSKLSVAPWVGQIGGTGVSPVTTWQYNAIAGPDGSNSVTRLVFDRGASNTSTDQSRLHSTLTLTAGQPYIFSIWLRTTSGSGSQQLLLELTSGTTQLATVTGAWQRFTVTSSAGIGSAQSVAYLGTRGTFGSDQQLDVLAFGAQVESGLVATGLIPTTSAAVTVTDFSVSGSAIVCAVAPLAGAALTFDGQYQR